MGGYTGWLFLFGLIVGAIGLIGVGLMLRGMARHRTHRRELKGHRREAQDLRKREEELSSQLEKERAERARLEAAAGTDTRQRTGEVPEHGTQAGTTDTGGGTRGTETGGAAEPGSAAAPPRQRAGDEHAGLRERLGFGPRKK